MKIVIIQSGMVKKIFSNGTLNKISNWLYWHILIGRSVDFFILAPVSSQETPHLSRTVQVWNVERCSESET